MSSGWDYVGNSATLDFVLAQKPGDRRTLTAIFERLCDNPASPATAHVRDDTGRKLSIIYSQAFRVTFWVDHFAKEIRIVDVHRG